METKITEHKDDSATFTVALTEVKLSAIKKHVFDELRGRVKAAGFRPGHAPDMIVERELGASMIQNEFLEHAIQESYLDAVREHKLSVVSSPKVSIEKFVPYTTLEYKVTVELMPRVKLADYKDFRIKKPTVTVDASAVNRTVEDLRRREAVRLDSEQPAKTGDEVNFDFDGTDSKGTAVPGASAKGQTLQLGSATFIPGFEDAIVGLKKGEDKTFEIRFPKTYHEKSLQDKLVTFKIHINSVTDLVLPEIDDEFVKKVSPFKSLDELKSDIEDRIRAEETQDSENKYEKEVLDKLLEKSTYKTPEALVTQQLDRLRGELEQNLAYSGLDIEKYLSMTGKSNDDLTKEMRPEAERRVGLAMVLTEVAAVENLTVAPKELSDEIDRLKKDYPDPKARAELENPSTKEEVYNHLMASKVIRQLLEYASQ
jgi:trigger factor